MEQSDEIKKILSKYYEAMIKRDHLFINQLISKQSGTLVIGTDPNEWWVGHNHIMSISQKQSDEMSGLELVKSDPIAYRKDNVAWIADQALFKLGETEIPCRITGVLEKEEEGWKFVQIHSSIGVNNEEVIGKELPLE